MLSFHRRDPGLIGLLVSGHSNAFMLERDSFKHSLAGNSNPVWRENGTFDGRCRDSNLKSSSTIIVLLLFSFSERVCHFKPKEGKEDDHFDMVIETRSMQMSL